MNILDEIIKDFDLEYLNATDIEAYNNLRVKYLGKNGRVTEALKEIQNIPVSEKKAYGESVNSLKNVICVYFYIIIYLCFLIYIRL